MRTLTVILCLLLAFSCGRKECKIKKEIAEIPVDVNIVRLDQALFSIESQEALAEFLDEYPVFSDVFLQKAQYPNQALFVDNLFQLINDPHIDTLYQETQTLFGDASELKEELTTAFKHLKHYYPDFTPPKIYTAITGLNNDLYVSDSLIVIGLDYYLGDEATFRPIDLPDYILKRYRKEYIVPSITLLLSKKYNETDYGNKSMLADMIFYGKSYYFASQMMPCTPDSLLIGYTAQEMRDVQENEDIIWGNFIHNELLYETSHIMKNKFLGERPRIHEIGPKCPGRIGAWVGWEIVKQYMDKNKKSLPELMRNSNAQQLFTESKYRPD